MADDHYARAEVILEELDVPGQPPTLMIKVAEVHALLALVQVARYTTHTTHPAQPTPPAVSLEEESESNDHESNW
jgi:hypothetical protein